VAGGDINGDGFADVVVTPDVGGGPRVVIFQGKAIAAGQAVNGVTGQGVLVSFFGIPDPDFRGGARVAVGDVNGDGTPDVVVAAGERGAAGRGWQIWDGKAAGGRRSAGRPAGRLLRLRGFTAEWCLCERRRHRR
jgi:hypothetical protein